LNNKLKNIATLSCLLASSSLYADFNNTLYGDFRFSAGFIDRNSTKSDGLTANNNASRIGFKGSVGDSRLKAIYHLQAGAKNDGAGEGAAAGNNSAFTARFYFAGLKSADYGSLIYGRHSTAYKMSGLRVDPFYDTSAGLGNGGATYGLSGMTNGFTNNAIAYISPTILGGLSANAAIYIDDSEDNDHDTNFGLQYAADGMTFGVQQLIIGNGSKASNKSGIANTAGVESATRLYASYKTDKWSLSGSYELQIAELADQPDINHLYVAGTYKIMEDTKLAVSVGHVDDGPFEGVGWQTGIFYNILPKTEVYALYSGTYLENNFKGDANVFTVGVSHKFALSH
jgi:predicted porin